MTLCWCVLLHLTVKFTASYTDGRELFHILLGNRIIMVKIYLATYTLVKRHIYTVCIQ